MLKYGANRPPLLRSGRQGPYLPLVYHTCLHCTRDLGQNDIVELLPIGRRIAFDAARGRLWVVCRNCGKWNLVPFDNRLEAIDVCEKLFHDTRKRFSTEQIGLARMADGTDLVRIGEPQRPEFASWRYGAQYKRRRRKQIGISVIGGGATMVAAGALEMTALQGGLLLGLAGLYLPSFAWQLIQTRRRRVLANVPGRESPLRLDETALASVHVSVENGGIQLGLHTGLFAAFRKRVVTIVGPDTRMLTRRIMATLNERAGSGRHISQALGRIEAAGVEGWLRRLDRESISLLDLPLSQRWRHNVLLKSEQPARYPGFFQGVRVAGLPAGDRLAIEMWLSEEDEARALSGELALLERQWKEAEELAAIADGLAIATVVEP